MPQTKSNRRRQQPGSKTRRQPGSKLIRQYGGSYGMPMEYYGVQGSQYFNEGSPSLNSYAPDANSVVTVAGQGNIYVDTNGNYYAGQNLVPGGHSMKTLMVGGKRAMGKEMKKKSNVIHKKKSNVIHKKSTSPQENLQRRFI